MAKELTLREKAVDIQHFLSSRKGAFAELMPKHMTPEKLVKGILAAATRNPRILECTQQSILNCAIVSASMGLDIGRPRGGAYMVPFRNNKAPGRPYEATLIPDYRGLMDLAYRSGRVLSIEARAVYSADDFDWAYGSDTHITHKPALSDRGELIAVYGVAHIKDARPALYVMGLDEVNEHRARSRAAKEGPWVTDYVAMALKTVVKSLVNWLPQSQDDLLERAVEYDSRQDRGEGVADLFDVIEVESEHVDDRSGAAKEALQAKQGGDGTDQAAGEDSTSSQESTTPAGSEPAAPSEAQATVALSNAADADGTGSKPEPKKSRKGKTESARSSGEGDLPPSPPDPEASPSLPDNHDNLMAIGGGYQAAFNVLEKAFLGHSVDTPKLVADAWDSDGPEWSEIAGDAAELAAIGKAKAYFFAKAADNGFPQE